MSAYEVDHEWETELEPGTWYRIVKGDNPHIIAGYVFVPPRGATDYRDVDGTKLSKANRDHREMVPQWDAAIQRHVT